MPAGRLDLVYVSRRDPHLDRQPGALGHDGREAGRRGDDAADGEDGHLVDCAGDRRADIGAREPVLIGNPAILQLRELGLGLAQLALGLGAGGVADRDDLQCPPPVRHLPEAA